MVARVVLLIINSWPVTTTRLALSYTLIQDVIIKILRAPVTIIRWQWIILHARRTWFRHPHHLLLIIWVERETENGASSYQRTHSIAFPHFQIREPFLTLHQRYQLSPSIFCYCTFYLWFSVPCIHTLAIPVWYLRYGRHSKSDCQICMINSLFYSWLHVGWYSIGVCKAAASAHTSSIRSRGFPSCRVYGLQKPAVFRSWAWGHRYWNWCTARNSLSCSCFSRDDKSVQ